MRDFQFKSGIVKEEMRDLWTEVLFFGGEMRDFRAETCIFGETMHGFR